MIDSVKYMNCTNIRRVNYICHAFVFVAQVGVEPTRKYKFRGILSPLCLPISPPGQLYGGAFQSRTELYEFAIRCITALLTRHLLSGAGNEVRTRDPNHGKVMLYQLSYSRIQCVPLYRKIFSDQEFTKNLIFFNN